MKRVKNKKLHLLIEFDKLLKRRNNALGMYHFICNASNKALIKIHPYESQGELINTLFHEFAHFVKELVYNERFFTKYFYPITVQGKKHYKKVYRDTKYANKKADKLEEILCQDIGSFCAKRMQEHIKTTTIKRKRNNTCNNIRKT